MTHELNLTTPSWLGLAWYLEHPESWPKKFRWDYEKVDNCALGLGSMIWGRAFDDSHLNSHVPGLAGREIYRSNEKEVTPAMVAEKIYKFLTSEVISDPEKAEDFA